MRRLHRVTDAAWDVCDRALESLARRQDQRARPSRRHGQRSPAALVIVTAAALVISGLGGYTVVDALGQPAAIGPIATAAATAEPDSDSDPSTTAADTADSPGAENDSTSPSVSIVPSTPASDDTAPGDANGAGSAAPGSTGAGDTSSTGTGGSAAGSATTAQVPIDAPQGGQGPIVVGPITAGQVTIPQITIDPQQPAQPSEGQTDSSSIPTIPVPGSSGAATDPTAAEPAPTSSPPGDDQEPPSTSTPATTSSEVSTDAATTAPAAPDTSGSGSSSDEDVVPSSTPNGSSSTSGSQPSGSPSTSGSQPSGSPSTSGSQPSGSPNTSGSQPSGSPNTSGSQPSGSPNTSGSQPSGSPNTFGSQPSGSPNTSGSQPSGSPSTSGSGSSSDEDVVPSSTPDGSSAGTSGSQPSGSPSTSSPPAQTTTESSAAPITTSAPGPAEDADESSPGTSGEASAGGATDAVFSLTDGLAGLQEPHEGNVENGEDPQPVASPNVPGREAIRMALPAGGKRSEVRPQEAAQDIRAGQRLFFGYSAFLPENFPVDFDGFQVIWQLHDGTTSTSPPVALEVRQGKLWLANVGDLVQDLGPVTAGQNLAVQMEIDFQVGGGSVSLWRDGRQVLTDFQPPQGTMIDEFDYLKTGLYRSQDGGAPATELFLNDLKIGDSLESVSQLAGAPDVAAAGSAPPPAPSQPTAGGEQ